MTTAQKISIAILAKVNSGMTIRDAFDAVLGLGAYDKLASGLHDELNGRG